MKYRLVLMLFGIMSVFYPIFVWAQEVSTAEKIEVTIVGEVVDSVCYLDNGGRGEDHKACAISCSQAGLPVAILEDDTEFLYVAITPDHQPGNSMLEPYMAQRVEVKGKLIEGNGLTLIEVEEVKPAA